MAGCLLLCVTGIGLAQNSNSADLRGTATDPSGAILPGVTVTVVNNDTGVSRVFVTNSDGLYDSNSILPGTYTVTFAKAGFRKLVKDSIVLQVGLSTVDGALKVGSVTEEVVVTSNAPLLKTEDAQVSNTLSTQQLTNLPNVDPANGWTYLLKLLPGATSTPGGTNGGGSLLHRKQLDWPTERRNSCRSEIGPTLPLLSSQSTRLQRLSTEFPHAPLLD